jgi:DNA-binding transcriptional MerR regulator
MYWRGTLELMTDDKTGVVAKRLNIHPNTVRNYADRYGDLLSKDATGRKRTFNYDDLLILATISEFRDSGMEWEQIRVALEQGQRVASVPELPSPEVELARKALDLVPKPHVDRLEERLRELERQRDSAMERLERVMMEVQNERRRIQDEHEQELSSARENWQAEVSTLRDKISTLERERGLLEGELKAVVSERRPASYWLAVIAGIVVIVVIMAAVVVVYLGSRV